MNHKCLKLGIITMAMYALTGIALADEARAESDTLRSKVSFPLGTNPIDQDGNLILGSVLVDEDEEEETDMISSSSEISEKEETEAMKKSGSSLKVDFPLGKTELDENGVPIFGPSIKNENRGRYIIPLDENGVPIFGPSIKSEDGSPRYIFPLKDIPIDKDGNAQLTDPLDYRRSFPNNTIDMIIKKYSENDHDPREEPVRNMTQKPFHSILYLLLKRSDEDRITEQCTGTVIGKNIILTAGHCVASDSDISAGTVKVGTVALPSQMGRKHDLTFDIEESIAHPIWLKGWREPNRFDYDVAVLKTRPNAEGKDIGEILEKLSLKIEDGSQLGWNVSNPGYPTRMIQEYGLNIWNTTGNIVKEYDEIYKTDFTTSVGQSGSPLLNSKNEVIGTLSYGDHETSGYIRMRPEIYDWIQEHVTKFEGSVTEKKEESSPYDEENEKDQQDQVDKDMVENLESSQPDKSMIQEVNKEKNKSDDKVVSKLSSKALPNTGTKGSLSFLSFLCVILTTLGYSFYRLIRCCK